jgi:hypothetical protein
MKVRPFERSILWRSAFSKKKNDPDDLDREALANAYRQLRDRAGDLVGEIHAALPHLTVHDLTHADTLWDVASEICGPKYTLNPLEAFVLGACFLLHDAGTRVGIRVSSDVLWRLVNFDHRAAGAEPEATKLLSKRLVARLSELVAPLDVSVGLLIAEAIAPISLSRPLLYEQDKETIVRTLQANRTSRNAQFRSERVSQNQMEMLMQIGTPNSLFGYAALNISSDIEPLLKSIGGLGFREMAGHEAIWGVAEFLPNTAARRLATELAAPPEALQSWVQKQVELVKFGNLNESERQSAIQCLGELGYDITQIFRTLTSKGPLDLDQFMDVLKTYESALFPVQKFEFDGLDTYHSRLPSLPTEFYYGHMRPQDIEFEGFVIYSNAITATSLDLETADTKYPWGVVLARLRKQNVQHEVRIDSARKIGRYIGLDSQLHNLSVGDVIQSDVIELRLT